MAKNNAITFISLCLSCWLFLKHDGSSSSGARAFSVDIRHKYMTMALPKADCELTHSLEGTDLAEHHEPHRFLCTVHMYKA